MGELKNRSPLETSLGTLLERRRTNSTLRTLTVNPPKVDFSSNDFLSLSKSREMRVAFLEELQSHEFPLGSGGSRLLDGNSQYAEDLEKEIANFHGAEAGLLFNSGFDANAGFFACVPQKGDVIVYDELIHASVHDGMRLSRASKRIPFKHNCIDDLRRVLGKCLQEVEGLRDGKNHVLVAVEAIYSMDGDLAPLERIVSILDEVLPSGAGYVVVDEAHATGVLGSNGRGLVCDSGLEKRVFARLHTFGKGLACNGGKDIFMLSLCIIANCGLIAIILSSELLRQYLINYARPLIYTTFMSYPALAAIKASYGLLQRGRTTKVSSFAKTIDSVNAEYIIACVTSPVPH